MMFPVVGCRRMNWNSPSPRFVCLLKSGTATSNCPFSSGMTVANMEGCDRPIHDAKELVIPHCEIVNLDFGRLVVLGNRNR